MRDVVQTDDDVAIAAAKDKLAALAKRPGYEEAMHPKPTGSAKARAVTLCIAAVLVALAVVTFKSVTAAWLAWVLLLLFSAMAVFTALAAIGFGPDPAATAVPAILLAKRMHIDLQHATLLTADGQQVEKIVLGSLSDVLKIGDVGVAHINHNDILIEFHRL